MQRGEKQSGAARVLGLGCAMALLWGILSDNTGWAFGLVAATAASFASVLLAPLRPPRLNFGALFGFLAFLLKETAVGGIDVSRRALHPDLPVAPNWLYYRVQLPPGQARTLFFITINLTPGTLTAGMYDDSLVVHTLVESSGTLTELASLEQRVADLFGLVLPAHSRPEVSDE